MTTPLNCSFTPKALPEHTPVNVSDQPPNGVKVQYELLRRLGMVSEVDWAKYTDTVSTHEKLMDIMNRNYFETLMAKKVHINPKHVDRVQQWLARHFPSFANEASTPKQVRNFLRDAKRAGEALLDVMPFWAKNMDEAFAKFHAPEVIKDAYTRYKATLKAFNVEMGNDTLGRIWVKAIEVGQTDRILRMTSAGENAKKIMQHRYDKFIDELAGHGISKEGAGIIMEIASEVTQAYDNLLVVAKSFGVNVKDLQDVGYFNRVMSKDLQFNIRKAADDVYGKFLESPHLGLGAAFQKSRTTHDFIVEDELLLAAALGYTPPQGEIKRLRGLVDSPKTSPKVKANAQQRLETLLDEARSRLTDVLTDDVKLRTELAGLTDDTLNTLVDSGVLSKLPMLSDEVFDVLKQKYKLPYRGLEEMMITDPVRAYKIAEQQMKQALGKSVMGQAMFKDAVEMDWGVTEAQRLADPEQYSKFVKLAPEVYTKYGVDEIAGARSLYVHPMVADIFTGMLEVATDPIQMGTFASIWHYLNRVFKMQALGTTGFVGRQVWQVFMSSAISGTNLANMIPSIYDYIRFNKLGFDAFDNTKKVFAGGTMTEREMVMELIKRGALDSDSAPIAGDMAKKVGETYSSLNPKNAGRALGYWGAITNKRGVIPRIKDGKLHWDAVEYGADLMERLTSEASGRVMSAGVFLENAAKLAHFRSTLRDGAANAIGQFITNGKRFHFIDVDEAVKHSRDYFFDYGDVGLGDKAIARNILPFWIYTSRNLPAVVRHALRNPTQYMAYQRLYALLNDDVREAGESAPEGGFRDYQQGFGRIYLKHPDGSPDKWLHIPFTPFDPIADATNTAQDGYQGLAKAFGFFTGNYKEKVDSVSPKSATIPFVDGILDQGYGSIKSLYALFTRTHPQYKTKLTQDDASVTSLLGVEIPGKFAPLTKFLIENTLPSVRNLNAFNPGEIFGLKEQKDANGNVVREAKPSVFGGRRSDTDADVDTLRSTHPIVTLIRASGLTVESVDAALNMQYTENDLKYAAQDMQNYGKRLAKEMGKHDPNSPEYKKIEDTHPTAQALYVEIENGRAKGQVWLNKRGYQTRTEQKKIERILEQFSKTQP